MSTQDSSDAARKLGRLGASKGGKTRAENLNPEERKKIAQKAAKARWSKDKNDLEEASSRALDMPQSDLEEASSRASDIETLSAEDIESALEQQSGLPTAIFWGALDLVGVQLPCYVLDDGQRIIGRTAANEMLTGVRGSGKFEGTISVASLKPFLDSESIIGQLVAFRLPDVEGLGKNVKGLPADLLIDVCRGFVAALESSYNQPSDTDYPLLTPRQREMAIQASIFLGAVAKVGLDALIDEATGYQEVREKDALAIKLKAYLEDEMRKWEKTFPDELWMEFGRLTNWQGSIKRRPKYWGKLVMELIYEYLDPDVAQWLRENAPKPRGGQNYHQWLSSQYGLKKLIEHIWMVIGMARACDTMHELKQKMAACFGTEPVQLKLTLPRSAPDNND